VTEATHEKCETCEGTGVYHTGGFVGDDEFNLKPIMAYCPDCPAGLARAGGVDTLRE
jgi:hypothetical protein